MEAGNQTLLKKNNQRSIAEYIIKNGPISRSDLSRTLDISKPTVSANVAELIEQGVLKEIGYGPSTIGKRPLLIGFNKKYRFVLALDFISFLKREKIQVAVCNLFCEPLFVESVPAPFPLKADYIKNEIPDAILAILKKHRIPLSKVGKVVFTVASSHYDDIENINFECNDGENVNLSKLFEPYFKDKLVGNNDINLCALGEKYYGGGRGVKNMAYFWIGLALGGGVIIDNRLHEGNRHRGGEFSTTIVYDEEGSEYNQLRYIVDTDGIRSYVEKHREEALKSAIGAHVDKQTYYLDMIIEAALAGDKFAIGFGKYIGKMLAVPINNFSNTMDLDMVIIGGEYSSFGDILLDPIREAMASCYTTHAVVTTPEHSDSAVYGAFQIGTKAILESLVE